MKYVFPLLVATASAFGQPKPVPKAETTPTENFAWKDPFTAGFDLYSKFEPACTSEKTFKSSEFLLHDLYEKAPLGLWAYADALKDIFTGKPYPGGWDGLDPHMYERPLLSMEYGDVPLAVREWIEAQQRGGGGDDGEKDDEEDEKDQKDDKKEGKDLFAVFERQTDSDSKVAKTVTPLTLEKTAKFRMLDKKRIVVFAPGALYRILPLWVADGSSCQETLRDLDRYSPDAGDGGVIAWTTAHTTPNRNKGEREVTFTIKAQVMQSPKEGQKEEL